MAKGRFLKSAERACVSKARFATAYEAERASEWRFRAYQCPVCHHYHLTSTAGRPTPMAAPEAPVPPPPKPSGPTLADLDWSSALYPKPKEPRPPKRPKRPPPPPEPAGTPARCTGKPGKDHRVALVVEGRLVKSAPIRSPELRARLAPDVWVVIDDAVPPVVLRCQG